MFGIIGDHASLETGDASIVDHHGGHRHHVCQPLPVRLLARVERSEAAAVAAPAQSTSVTTTNAPSSWKRGGDSAAYVTRGASDDACLVVQSWYDDPRSEVRRRIASLTEALPL
jgi:hypothetical protein